MEITFDKVKLGEIFNISSVGLAEYILGKDKDCVRTSKFTNRQVTNTPCKVLKGKMPPFLKLLFELVHKRILSRENVVIRQYLET